MAVNRQSSIVTRIRILPRDSKTSYARVMEEIEHHFNCPYCFESISMLLDGSLEDIQDYIEDCQVCCQPIEIRFQIVEGSLVLFDAEGT